MRQVSSLISTYSSDEFGICSALYELGGMVVMHDASGCNSTYTTHDEPRWYEMDSMIYISAISEMEAIMGDDGKFLDDLENTAKELHPKFIALVGAPIPYMIGTDFQALAQITQKRTKIPCFGFEANGMHHYTKGVSMALERLADYYCKEDRKSNNKDSTDERKLVVNILGATPLDFSVNGSIEDLKAWLLESGFEVGACFAFGADLEEIKKAGEADVNLVVSYGGLAAAKLLKERFGTPYLVGLPFGKDGQEILGKMILGVADKNGENQRTSSHVLYKNDEGIAGRKEGSFRLGILGESVYCASLARAIEARDQEIVCKVLCPVDSSPELLRKGDRKVYEEDDIIRELGKVDALMADPLYQALVKRFSPQTKFYPLPHEAFSGRIYDPVNPNLMGEKLDQWLSECGIPLQVKNI